MDKVRQIRLAKDAMDRDWADPELDLDAVAAHAGYSRYHFLRAFKEAYGETPGQYLTHRRIERAEEMLRGADLSVTEICHLVGFSSLGTFSARFKTRTGLTPSEYRTRHVGRGAALIPGCYAMLWAGGFPTARSTASTTTGTAGPASAAGTAGAASAAGAASPAGTAGTAGTAPPPGTPSTATSEKRPRPAAAYRDGEEPPDDRRAEP